MNKKHISFPSIEQFRHVVDKINRRYNFVGLDSNGDPIYDETRIKPVLTFKGTVKLHGTNGSVCVNNSDGLWVQSRESIISVLSDNAGFAFFCESKKESFLNLVSKIANRENIDLNENTISIFGEWVGKGIQKTVAISQIPKTFFIFGVKVTPNSNDDNDLSYWVDYSDLSDHANNIYNIDEFQTYSIDIDFNNPHLYQDRIDELTMDVEKECPVAKYFGVNGIGEGIVFTAKIDNEFYNFKSKGDKHAKSKVKVLTPVDNTKINKLIEIAEKVTPSWRLSQMLEQACDFMNGGNITRTKLGDYIKLVIDDIMKEEMDILLENNITPKELNKYISEIARNYFFEREKDLSDL